MKTSRQVTHPCPSCRWVKEMYQHYETASSWEDKHDYLKRAGRYLGVLAPAEQRQDADLTDLANWLRSYLDDRVA